MKKQNTNAGSTGRQLSRLLQGHFSGWLIAVVAAGVMSFAAPASADLTIDISGHAYESQTPYTQIRITVSKPESIRSHKEVKVVYQGPTMYGSARLMPRIKVERDGYNTFRAMTGLEAEKYYLNERRGVEMWQGDKEWQDHIRAATKLPLKEASFPKRDTDGVGTLFMTPDDYYENYLRQGNPIEQTRATWGGHSSLIGPGVQKIHHRFEGTTIRANKEYGYFRLSVDGELKLGLPLEFADDSGVLREFTLVYTFEGRLPADFGFMDNVSQTFVDDVFGKVKISTNTIEKLPMSPDSTIKKGVKYITSDGKHYLIHAKFDNNLMLVRTANDSVVWGLHQYLLGNSYQQADVVRYNNTGTLEVLDRNGKVIYEKKIGGPGSKLELDATGNFTAK